MSWQPAITSHFEKLSNTQETKTTGRKETQEIAALQGVGNLKQSSLSSVAVELRGDKLHPLSKAEYPKQGTENRKEFLGINNWITGMETFKRKKGEDIPKEVEQKAQKRKSKRM